MMAAARAPSPAAARALIVRAVMLEVIRRKEFYVLAILAALFAAGFAVARAAGIENSATAVFLLNLGLTLAGLAAHGLALVTAARQIPNELEARTICPILAKPIARADFFLGKWAASALVGVAAYAALTALAWAAAPKEAFFHPLLAAQAVALQCLSIALLSALAISLSLVLARGANLVLLGLVFMAGDKALMLARAHGADTPLAGAIRWCSGYAPDFAALNLITRFTDGMGPVGAGEFAGLVFHGVVISAVALALGARAFERRGI